MEKCDLHEWVYLNFEKIWVCVNLNTEKVIAIVKTKKLN